MIRHWFFYLFALVAAGLFHVFWVNYLSLFVFFFLLALPLFSLLLMFATGRCTAVKLETAEEQIQSGAPIVLRIVLKTALPMGNRIKLRLVVSNHTMQTQLEESIILYALIKEQIIEHQLISQYSGELCCRIAGARIYDLLGLFWYPMKLGTEQKIFTILLPRLHQLALPVRDKEELLRNGEEFSVLHSGNDPSELFGIRAFQEGDRLSQIHWKLSGKLGQMLVREGGCPTGKQTLILVDFCGEISELDALLQLLFSLMETLRSQQISHNIGWYNSLRNCFTLIEVEKDEMVNDGIGTILSTIRPQIKPEAIEGFDDDEQYTQVLYLCPQLFPGAVTALRERFPSCEISIFHFGEPGEMEVFASASQVELIAVDRENFEILFAGDDARIER